MQLFYSKSFLFREKITKTYSAECVLSVACADDGKSEEQLTSTDCRPTVGRQSAVCRSTVGRQSRPTVGRLLVDSFCHSGNHLSADRTADCR